jgi:mRNA interferase MazF
VRAIHWARLDKIRPALILTRSESNGRDVTVAGITSTIHGVPTELPVGVVNGLDHDCVVNLDDIQTVNRERLGKHMGHLFDAQESALHAAIVAAFDLEE